MKIIRPIFSFVVWAALGAPTQAQSPQNFEGQGRTAVQDAAANQDAETLVERAEGAINQFRSLSAKVRNQVDLFDHQATGTGQYLQQGRGLGQLSRFELKSQLGGATSTLLQIDDGRFFWTFRELPSGPSLNKLDLTRIQAQLPTGMRPLNAAPTGQMPIGGLSKMLAGLRRSFQFDRLGETLLGDRRVWAVDGQWRPAQLATAVPDQRGTIEAGRTIELKKLPAHLPEHVVLYVGQADLFPYRIEFLRRSGTSNGEGQGGILPGYHAIVATAFFDVRFNVPIDPNEFVYQPSLKATDTTDAYLKALSGGGAK